MAQETLRPRGRTTRDRRIAEQAVRMRGGRDAVRWSQSSGAAAGRARTPDLSVLATLLGSTGSLRDLAERLARGRDPRHSGLRHVAYAEMPHGAKSFLAAGLLAATGERLVWVARDAEVADRVAEELLAWLGDPASVVTLEPRTALALERSELVRDESAARVAALAAWRSGVPRVLVASVQALFQRTLPPADLPEQPIELHVGQRIAQARVLRELAALGYESLPEVGGRGEIARRGGIVDVFPAGHSLPVRAEWFGDEIESLRAFDPTDQRTVGTVESLRLLPASEFLLPAGVDSSGGSLRERLGRLAARLPEQLAIDLDRLEQGQPTDALEVWAGLLAPASALDHLGDEIVLLDEPADVAAAADFLWSQADERRAELERAGELPKGWPAPFPERRQWKRRLAEWRTLELSWESDVPGAPVGGNPFGWREPSMPPAVLTDLAEAVRRWQAEGLRVVLTSDQSARLAEILAEGDVMAAPVSRLSESPPEGGVALVDRSLNGGFSGGPDGLVVVTDRELFGTVRVRRPRVHRRATPGDLLERLQPGDMVVHIDHGVARYAGLTRRSVGDEGVEERDFIELHFAEGGRIWVPVEQIERISRYAGGESPQLSRLGGGEWQRMKTRVRRAVEDLARELLALYASRADAHGPRIGADTPWQSEMEAAFPYEETVDQLRSVLEVKADLERGRPMDRLVVGDVGYGKTEVALRACFKAIQEGLQVAVLVPTTVLAAQHYETFRQRLAAYPITIRTLSRFVPMAEQRETLAGLAAGSVDLVIGTHRLLSRDVRFKDLGLIVVDEEQRFGVAHKERLKQLRTEVHVLTLSATPIPRTLNLALAGVRDMSVIETPPEDRLPIQTRVAEASAGLVRDAILRELDRGGQVFFVHNRVETIEAQAEQLRRMLPAARVAVAHGQMAEGALERAMLAFARGEFDVLVCTTIIESGLDIPNANTIIIDRADTLGLAQLYQLRGRVGRSSRRAYAYLLYRRRGQLSDVARKRLQAIFNASELGAGFQIALSDLEIRGAGNILGAEQHGHMAAVGFDMYTRMLAEAVEVERATAEGRPAPVQRAQAVVDLPIDAYLPDDYVQHEPQKLELYRRLGRAATEGEVAAVAAEMVDRFGPLPPPVDRLLEVARLRIAADAAGIASLAREGRELVVRFGPDWSRAETARRMAPMSMDDRLPGVPAGGISYGSNQMRVRLPGDGDAAWATTRAVVERLSRAA
ncbi:MAG TPA: transcription-repair coupling factor [Candidatus Limnocylindrales bacterium]|nr:transcription-repair coupling factor [Candidatus Limnocylindrales bacterium]